jgi:hypothetical protein
MPDQKRIDDLARQLEAEKMKTALAREEALASARMTHPEIKRKRRTLNVVIIGAAVVVLGVLLFIMLRPGERAERHSDDDAWSLPPPEPLPDAPELPDLTKKEAKTPHHGGTTKTKQRDLLGDIGEETEDPIGN